MNWQMQHLAVEEGIRRDSYFAREGGVYPKMQEPFSLGNSMDWSDLDELPDEAFKYHDD